MKKTVILIHGLFLNVLSLNTMRKKFIKKGFDVHSFGYNTVKFSSEDTTKRLNELISTIESEDITLIGHSMGGLVARNYYDQYESLKVKKIITLATPHNGSHVAKYLIKTKLSFILGTSGTSGIVDKLPEWQNKCSLGCVIAISKIGINLILTPFHGKKGRSDGNVFIEEAMLESATDNFFVNKTHSGVLFSPDVFNQCLYFIENNHFKK